MGSLKKAQTERVTVSQIMVGMIYWNQGRGKPLHPEFRLPDVHFNFPSGLLNRVTEHVLRVLVVRNGKNN